MNVEYVAGLLDGEGYLGLYKRNKKKSTYAARVVVGMTKPALPLLKNLREEYGGSLSQTRRADDKRAAAWKWGIMGGECISMLLKVRPHLLLKSDHADLLISFQRAKREQPKASRGTKWTKEFRETAETIYQQLKLLNQKGPREKMKDGWIARHVGEGWLTPQLSLFSAQAYTEFSGAFPKSGMMRNGHVYPLPALEHRTSAYVFSSSPSAETLHEASWPTPAASDGTRGGTMTPAMTGQSLAQMANTPERWPTPTAQDAKNATLPPSQAERDSVPGAVMRRTKMLPTPTAGDATRGPDYAKQPREGGGGDDLTTASCRRAGRTGSLNPNLCRWLMGFPTGWSALEHSETP